MGSGQSSTSQGTQNASSIPIVTNPAVQQLLTSSAQGVAGQQAANPITGYNAANPMQVAPMTDLQNIGAAAVPGLNATPAAEDLAMQYARTAPGLAGRVATGAGIESDPAIKAQIANFYANTVPQLSNQYATMGLGRSSALPNTEANSLASMLGPMYESQLNREQGALSAEAATTAGLVSPLEAIGQGDTARLNQMITQAEAVGGTQQQTQQAGYTAQYQDYLRRQALAEEALFTPFNELVPAGSIGQLSTGTSDQTSNSSGGLFK